MSIKYKHIYDHNKIQQSKLDSYLLLFQRYLKGALVKLFTLIVVFKTNLWLFKYYRKTHTLVLNLWCLNVIYLPKKHNSESLS